MILKALEPHQYYDSDDEYALDRRMLHLNMLWLIQDMHMEMMHGIG